MPAGMARLEGRELIVEIGKERSLFGSQLLLSDWQGWDGGAGVRRQSTPRLSNHGSLSVRGWRTERVLTLELSGWADDRAAAAQLVDDVTGFLADGDRGRVTVIDPDQGTRWVGCYLEGAPDVDWDTDTDFTATFDLVCPDPRKYGTQEIGGETSVAMPGGGLRFPLFVGGQLLEQRRNLFTNPSYEGGMSPATASTNASAAWQSSGGLYGPGRAGITATAAGLARAALGPHVVAAGETYTFSVYVRAAAARTWQLQFDYNSAPGVYQSATVSGNFAVPANTWTRLNLTATVPAGAVQMVPFVRITNAAAADLLTWDGALLELSPALGAYFDGGTADTSTAAFQWEGDPNASQSTQSAYGGRRGVLDFGKAGSTGTVVVQNVGTADIMPAFIIDGGGAPGFTITEVETGRRLVYANEVPSSQSLTLDARTGSVLLNGYAERSGGLVRAEWPTIPPKTTRTYLYESAGVNSRMTVKANPAWF